MKKYLLTLALIAGTTLGAFSLRADTATNAVAAVAALQLHRQGRPLWCACGDPRLWAGNVQSPHNSQHLLDPYSFTHLLHGFALCGLNRLDEAITAFHDFREKNPGHYLTPQATLGEAACLAMQSKKDAAKDLLQKLRAANRETPWDAAAKRMEGAIDRYQARPAHTLLEQANALAPIPAPPIAAPSKATP